jgi:hypothetical protein
MALSPETIGRLGFLAPRSIEREIGNVKWRFYAVRVPMVAELLTLSGPVATSLTTLFGGGKELRPLKSKQQDIITRDGDRQTVVDSEQAAASLEAMKYRDDAQRTAVTTLVDTLVGPKSQNILARFVMDSLRGDFPATPTQKDIDDFWNQLDLDVIFQFVAGALEANAQVIRPFLAKAGLNLQSEALSVLRAKVAPVLNLPPRPPAVPESATTLPTSDEPSSSS